MNVFIVDDSSIVCSGLETMLTELQDVHVIGKAATARDAIAAIEQLKPDVAILDIRLLEGNGIEVLQRVKGKENAPTIIMLTNYPYPQYKKKCMDLGADYFFDKVTEIETVGEIFREMLKKDEHERSGKEKISADATES